MDTKIWCCILCVIILIIVSANLAITIQTKDKCTQSKENYELPCADYCANEARVGYAGLYEDCQDWCDNKAGAGFCNSPKKWDTTKNMCVRGRTDPWDAGACLNSCNSASANLAAQDKGDCNSITTAKNDYTSGRSCSECCVETQTTPPPTPPPPPNDYAGYCTSPKKWDTTNPMCTSTGGGPLDGGACLNSCNPGGDLPAPYKGDCNSITTAKKDYASQESCSVCCVE